MRRRCLPYFCHNSDDNSDVDDKDEDDDDDEEEKEEEKEEEEEEEEDNVIVFLLTFVHGRHPYNYFVNLNLPPNFRKCLLYQTQILSTQRFHLY